MNNNPGARKNNNETTPHDAPYSPIMRDVDLRTTVSRQGVIVDGKDTLVSIYASNQGVDKEENQLCEREVRKGTCYCVTFQKPH